MTCAQVRESAEKWETSKPQITEQERQDVLDKIERLVLHSTYPWRVGSIEYVKHLLEDAAKNGNKIFGPLVLKLRFRQDSLFSFSSLLHAPRCEQSL